MCACSFVFYTLQASNLNHGCYGSHNVAIDDVVCDAAGKLPLVSFVALTDIQPGMELRLCYGDISQDHTTFGSLKGFTCLCPVCQKTMRHMKK